MLCYIELCRVAGFLVANVSRETLKNVYEKR